MDGMKIASAIFLILILVFLLPRAKSMLTNAPKAEACDWQASIIPLAAVVGFIALLMWLV